MKVGFIGTIGGNVCNGVTSADSASSLFAYNAILELTGPEGIRQVPIQEFYTGPGKTVRRHEEVMTAIRIRRRDYEGYTGCYIKYGKRNAWNRFFRITLPYMKSVIKVVLSMAIIENFKQFPLIWTMTGGGPDNSTTTLAILSYREAFVSNNLGSGAAVTTVWMLLMIVVVIVFNKLMGDNQTT